MQDLEWDQCSYNSTGGGLRCAGWYAFLQGVRGFYPPLFLTPITGLSQSFTWLEWFSVGSVSGWWIHSIPQLSHRTQIICHLYTTADKPAGGGEVRFVPAASDKTNHLGWFYTSRNRKVVQLSCRKWCASLSLWQIILSSYYFLLHSLFFSALNRPVHVSANQISLQQQRAEPDIHGSLLQGTSDMVDVEHALPRLRRFRGFMLV